MYHDISSTSRLSPGHDWQIEFLSLSSARLCIMSGLSTPLQAAMRMSRPKRPPCSRELLHERGQEERTRQKNTGQTTETRKFTCGRSKVNHHMPENATKPCVRSWVEKSVVTECGDAAERGTSSTHGGAVMDDVVETRLQIAI